MRGRTATRPAATLLALTLTAACGRGANPDADVRAHAARFSYTCHGAARQKAELNIEAVLAAPGGLTDAGDGPDRESGSWRDGRVVFADGTARPWQDVVTVVGASSGKPFPFGAGGVEVKPPGAVKFAVPSGAVRFEVRAVVDRTRNPSATVQAFVLRDAPKRGETSFYPGRPVFGGQNVRLTRTPIAKAKGPTPLEKQLNRRNVATTLRTKVGLNAERNVLADWTRCDVRYLGGLWPDQEVEKGDPLAPYHLTAEPARRNATPTALADLRARLDRLAAVAQVPHQDLAAALKRLGRDDARVGVIPASLPDAAEVAGQVAMVRAAERELEAAARPHVAAIARRAWRRPIADTEVDRLMRLYREGRAAGAGFDAAVKAPLLVVLASPHYLFHLPDPGAEAPAGAKVRDLTGIELASRLSFFLWASAPDEGLLKLAAGGALRHPAVLAARARRMLKDDRAKALTTVFAAQAFRFADYPRAAFDRLFDITGRLRDKSVLDAVLEQTRDVSRTLGEADRQKLDEFAHGVRDLERRIDRATKDGRLEGWRPTLTTPDMPRPAEKPPQDVREHMRMMLDLMVLAWQTDRTRVATLVLNRDVSHMQFGFLDGVENEQLHAISHHKEKPATLEQYYRINRFHTEQFAYLLKRLKAVDEGDGRSLLDSVAVSFGSNMLNGDLHDGRDLPLVLAGRAGGGITPGRVLDFRGRPEGQQRLCNLHLALAQRMGVDAKQFGDSTGPLAGLG